MPDDIDGDARFELRVSLKGTELLDSFSVALPSRFARSTLGDLIDEVFPEEASAVDEMLASLDDKSNPDLPDIYLALLEIIDTWRRGDCALYFFTNDDEEILPSQPVEDCLSPDSSPGRKSQGSRILSVAIERTFNVLASFEERGGDRGALFQWLQGMTLLYFIDMHGFQLRQSTDDEALRKILPIASDLQSRGVLSSSDPSGRFEITDEGRRTLGEMIAETESYIEQFDVFKDVSYDVDAEFVEFGAGHGADYRVQVYDAEGLDIYRTVFLLRMYDGTLDEHIDEWMNGIHQVEFFDELLRPVLDRDWVDDQAIEWIIENGLAHSEEQAEAHKERDSRQAIVRRIKSE